MVTTLQTWNNNDGLFLKFGPSEASSMQQGGFICQYGPLLKYVWNMDLTNLDQNETIMNDVLVIPKLSLIESVEVRTITAAATGVAIDVGLVANDRNTATALNAGNATSDPDGLLAAFITATMNAGGEYNRLWSNTAIPSGIAGTGALIGQILTVPTLLTCSQTTATSFTAGRIQLIVNVVPEAVIGFGVVHS